jgi:hypothetical protein
LGKKDKGKNFQDTNHKLYKIIIEPPLYIAFQYINPREQMMINE